MFNQLGDRLKQTFDDLRGRGRLTDDHVAGALRDVRVALLEADVALPAVKTFVNRVRERAVGHAQRTRAEARGERARRAAGGRGDRVVCNPHTFSSASRMPP